MASYTSLYLPGDAIAGVSWERAPWIPSNGQWSQGIPPEVPPTIIYVGAPNQTPLFG